MKKAIMLVVVGTLIAIMLKTYIEKEVASNRALNANTLGDEFVLEGEITAPDFTLRTLDGQYVTLSDLRGKNVVLNFWATWCVPCKAEMPEFQRYYKQYRNDDNVEIIAVNMTYKNDMPRRVEQFIEAFDLTFPIVLEPVQSVSNHYEILTIPSTFFIDTTGNIQHYIQGPIDTENLRRYVQQLNS